MNLKIIHNPNHKLHSPPFEIYDGIQSEYPENPKRIDDAIKVLKENNIKTFYQPKNFPIKHILEVHHQDYLDFLKKRSKSLPLGEFLYPSYYISDTYAPLANGTFIAAKKAADSVLTGASYLKKGDKIVYCLCRPPGHHATPKSMGGYCYLNNAAIAAQYLSHLGKVAILDIDLHHGNGTQDIFYKRNDVYFISIHADPKVKYPYSSGYTKETGEGQGQGFNKNYPLPLGTNSKKYLSVFHQSLKVIKQFDPKFLVVSIGFDTYQKDPIGGFKLTNPDYKIIGKSLANLKIPLLIVQEGGYYIPDFGQNLLSFIRGLEQ